jgi:hypothetical protein
LEKWLHGKPTDGTLAVRHSERVLARPDGSSLIRLPQHHDKRKWPTRSSACPPHALGASAASAWETTKQSKDNADHLDHEWGAGRTRWRSRGYQAPAGARLEILQAVDLLEVNFIKIKAKCRELPFNLNGKMGHNRELAPCMAPAMNAFAHLG